MYQRARPPLLSPSISVLPLLRPLARQPLVPLLFFPLRCFSSSPSSLSSSLLSPLNDPRDHIYLKHRHRSFAFLSDRVRIHSIGGRGGSGCSAFARTLAGKGAPNGGNGGSGGSVYLQTDTSCSFSLPSLLIRGGAGEAGTSENNTGKSGEHRVIHIPAGTSVSEIVGRDEGTDQYILRHVCDLNVPHLRVCIAKGGEGGWGNRAFKTSYRENNKFSTAGKPGEDRWFQLELKSLADVGLVGIPNAGKSSLLSAISAATPKIAAYPFTTMQPELGTVMLSSFASSPPSAFSSSSSLPSLSSLPFDRFTVADLPGLIEGASRNVGLGHSFLKHIERCKVIVYVVDMAARENEMRGRGRGKGQQPSERDPVKDFLSLQQELILYNAALAMKPMIVFANKCDLEGEEGGTYRRNVMRLRKLLAIEREERIRKGGGGETVEVIEGSAKAGIGIEEFIRKLSLLIQQTHDQQQQWAKQIIE